MSVNSNSLTAKQRVPLTSLSHSSPSTSGTSGSQSISRINSHVSEHSKKLVYKGQNVNVILPDVEPDTPISRDEIWPRVENIHNYDGQEVHCLP